MGTFNCWTCDEEVADFDHVCPNCFTVLNPQAIEHKANQKRTLMYTIAGVVGLGLFVMMMGSLPRYKYKPEPPRETQQIRTAIPPTPREIQAPKPPPAAIVVAPKKVLTDDEIKDQIIRDSRNGYSGNCACPYDRASNGSRCGKRSAYSRPSGAYVICYKHQISDEMVADAR
jgi:hypothetical protein